MARVHYVKKARKTVKALGIKKGQPYYWWKFRFGGKRVSLTPPRQSRLTQSEYLSAIYGAEETVEDALSAFVHADEGDTDDFEGSRSDVVDALNEAKSAVEEQRDACNEKADNVEQAFPNGSPVLDQLRERAEKCDEIISSLADAIGTVESADTVDEVEQAVNGISWECE